MDCALAVFLQHFAEPCCIQLHIHQQSTLRALACPFVESSSPCQLTPPPRARPNVSSLLPNAKPGRCTRASYRAPTDETQSTQIWSRARTVIARRRNRRSPRRTGRLPADELAEITSKATQTNLGELQRMNMPELMEEARKANLEEISGVKRQDLIFQILKTSGQDERLDVWRRDAGNLARWVWLFT